MTVGGVGVGTEGSELDGGQPQGHLIGGVVWAKKKQGARPCRNSLIDNTLVLGTQ